MGVAPRRLPFRSADDSRQGESHHEQPEPKSTEWDRQPEQRCGLPVRTRGRHRVSRTRLLLRQRLSVRPLVRLFDRGQQVQLLNRR